MARLLYQMLFSHKMEYNLPSKDTIFSAPSILSMVLNSDFNDIVSLYINKNIFFSKILLECEKTQMNISIHSFFFSLLSTF